MKTSMRRNNPSTIDRMYERTLKKSSFSSICSLVSSSVQFSVSHTLLTVRFSPDIKRERLVSLSLRRSLNL